MRNDDIGRKGSIQIYGETGCTNRNSGPGGRRLDVALQRFRVLRPALEGGVPLSRAAREASMPLRTAQRWMAAYKREGLAGLAPKGRSDRGRPRGLTEQLERIIEGLALGRPKPSMAAVHRQVVQIAGRYGWPEPTYRQVRGVIGRMEKGMLKLAHEGTRAYEEAFDLVHRREAARPNEVWQADHTLLDIRILDAKGKPKRPWLTMILDDHSRAVAGYHLSFDAPSAAGTALALRRAIRRKGEPGWSVCGIPESFYTDHGPDFVSGAWSRWRRTSACAWSSRPPASRADAADRALLRHGQPDVPLREAGARLGWHTPARRGGEARAHAPRARPRLPLLAD